MPIVASAPGKVVLLGEYVVLDGAKALVMAVDRRCRAELAIKSNGSNRLTTLMPEPSSADFAVGTSTGSTLVDAVIADFGTPNAGSAWSATIDSAAFYVAGCKLGLGSSAAALVAFAGAVWRSTGCNGLPPLQRLMRCHHAFQGGSGSGIDVAAAYTGGVIEFRLESAVEPRIGSVQLPKSVAFAGIFAGQSASTPDLVGRYRRWVDSGSRAANGLRQRMSAVAVAGCAAAEGNDGAAFIAAIDDYGHCMAELGTAMGAALVTDEHLRIGTLARELGLAYKVSGAGGGDIGIACGLDTDVLQLFSAKAAADGFRVVPLAIDEQGLKVEEHAE